MSDDQLREMATAAMRMAYQPTSFDKTFILADLRTARRIAAELGQALLDRLPPARVTIEGVNGERADVPADDAPAF